MSKLVKTKKTPRIPRGVKVGAVALVVIGWVVLGRRGDEQDLPEIPPEDFSREGSSVPVADGKAGAV